VTAASALSRSFLMSEEAQYRPNLSRISGVPLLLVPIQAQQGGHYWSTISLAPD
jgi:hypothetical protein